MDNGKWEAYRWADEFCPIPAAPEWCLKLLEDAANGRHVNSDGTERTGKGFTGDDLNNVVSGISEGERDEQINRFIWMCIGKGLAKDVVQPFALAAADYCIPPLEHEVVEEKIERAYSQNSNAGKKQKLSMTDIIANLKSKAEAPTE